MAGTLEGEVAPYAPRHRLTHGSTDAAVCFARAAGLQVDSKRAAPIDAAQPGKIARLLLGYGNDSFL